MRARISPGVWYPRAHGEMEHPAITKEGGVSHAGRVSLAVGIWGGDAEAPVSVQTRRTGQSRREYHTEV